jgi:biopolymer transport protein ExbD
MASKLGGGDDDAITDINITPFVDIILVVLIIFMVTATTIAKQAIKVSLPEAATGETTEATSLALMLEVGGNLLLDGEPISQNGLRNFIRAEQTRIKANGGDLVCLIAADTNVPHGDVIALIDLVKQEGVLKFALNIQPMPAPPEAQGAMRPALP